MILEIKNINKIPKMASISMSKAAVQPVTPNYPSPEEVDKPKEVSIQEEANKPKEVDGREKIRNFLLDTNNGTISSMKEVDNALIKKLLLAGNGLTEVPDFESVDEVILFWSRQGNPLVEHILAENNAVSEDTLVKLLMEDFKTTGHSMVRGTYLLTMDRISPESFIKLVDADKFNAASVYELKRGEEVPEEVLIRWRNEGKHMNWVFLEGNIENYKNEEFKRDIKEGYLRHRINKRADDEFEREIKSVFGSNIVSDLIITQGKISINNAFIKWEDACRKQSALGSTAKNLPESEEVD